MREEKPAGFSFRALGGKIQGWLPWVKMKRPPERAGWSFDGM